MFVGFFVFFFYYLPWAVHAFVICIFKAPLLLAIFKVGWLLFFFLTDCRLGHECVCNIYQSIQFTYKVLSIIEIRSNFLLSSVNCH